MPPSRGSGNSKKEQGQARKSEQKVKKQQEAEVLRAAQEEREWQKGANSKAAQRAEEAGTKRKQRLGAFCYFWLHVTRVNADSHAMHDTVITTTTTTNTTIIHQAAKADEAARKKREKEELLRQEEAELGTSSKVKKVPTLSKKANKKKDDLSLLEDALVKSAETSARAKKRAQQEREQEEMKRHQQKESRLQQTPIDPLIQNTNDMLNVDAGRSINKAIMYEGAASGIDAGLANLCVDNNVPQKSQKQLYKEFEERTMPQLKEDYPGLRLSQYQEKVFALWKKSPENPMNQVPTTS